MFAIMKPTMYVSEDEERESCGFVNWVSSLSFVSSSKLWDDAIICWGFVGSCMRKMGIFQGFVFLID